MSLRILSVGSMYPPHHRGGYELVWQSSTRHLRQQGHDVRVLTSELRMPDVPADAPEDPDVHRELQFYVAGRSAPIGRKGLLGRERRSAAAFDAHASLLKPDVVMWWHMLGIPLGLLERARRSGLVSMGVVHDEWPLYGAGHDGWSSGLAAVPGGDLSSGLVARVLGLPRGDRLPADVAWSFNSKWLRDLVTSRSAAVSRGSRLTVASPGINGADFSHSAGGSWAGRLLYVGRIDSRKGIEHAVRALVDLPGCHLDVVGGGDDTHRAALEATAAEIGVGDRLAFLPPVDRVSLAGVYAAHDALLFPVTWNEPWGLVPLEAMSVGVPVVATGTGGSGEYLRDAHNCLLVAPGEPAAIVRAVTRLANEPQLREQLRAGGWQTAAAYEDDNFQQALTDEVHAVAGGG